MLPSVTHPTKKFLVLLGLGCCLAFTFVVAPARADIAPAFTLLNAQGRPVSLSDFRGRPLVLHFWATWCPYCKKLQPGLDRLADNYREQRLVVLGISFSEDEGVQPQAVLTERGHRFETLLQGDEVAARYGVRGTPTTFFIDTQGIIQGRTSTSDPGDPVLVEMVGEILTQKKGR